MLDTEKSLYRPPVWRVMGATAYFSVPIFFPPNPKFLLRPYPPPWVTDIFRHCITMSFLISFEITESSCGNKCFFPPCPCTLYHKCLFQRYQFKTLKNAVFLFLFSLYLISGICPFCLLFYRINFWNFLFYFIF